MSRALIVMLVAGFLSSCTAAPPGLYLLPRNAVEIIIRNPPSCQKWLHVESNGDLLIIDDNYDAGE